MQNESNVNFYAKVFPAVFEYAAGDIVTDNKGKQYIDFFSGAGTLNYGHNSPRLKQAVITFLEQDRVLHCMDMDSGMKEEFLQKFSSIILQPRMLDYKIQFTGPTGTNAVEAAVKLARIITKRKKIVAFTHSFHGMTAASLALSGTRESAQAYNPSQEVIFFPYDGFGAGVVDSIGYLKAMITGAGSGVELPAALILETIQGEGGVNVATCHWLQELRSFTEKHGILLIVDDIQVGCGRSGDFFSFQRAGIVPDIVLLSKSISGLGLPLALVLIKPELDQWSAGEHNGTFRANNLSLCAATEALHFWKDGTLEKQMAIRSAITGNTLRHLVGRAPGVIAVRGTGMIWGIVFENSHMAEMAREKMFERGVLIETCGAAGNVLKVLPPLTIAEAHLEKGLDILAASLETSNQALLKTTAYEV